MFLSPPCTVGHIVYCCWRTILKHLEVVRALISAQPSEFWTAWRTIELCDTKLFSLNTKQLSPQQIPLLTKSFGFLCSFTLSFTKQGFTYSSQNQYSDVPINCLPLLPTLMNKELDWEETGINFIMFPVNHWVSWCYSVILGRACVPHLSKALCKWVIVLHRHKTIFPPLQHQVYTPYSDLVTLCCFKCCCNSPVNTIYVNCIMPRKQEAKMRNRHSLSLLLPLGLICHCFSSNDDTRWQRAGWYHLSSRASKGARVYNIWLL